MKMRFFLLLIAVFLVWMQSAHAFYNPSTGRWLSRDPIGEAGFELLANKSKNREITQLPVHFQQGIAELLAANPALAMRIQDRIAQIGKSSTTKIAPSAGNLYIFVQNDSVSKVDVLGLDVYFWACSISCRCRTQVATVVGVTSFLVSDRVGYRCCKATGDLFCAVINPLGPLAPAIYWAQLQAAEAYFNGCLLAAH